jgi:hypothetical protein
MKFGFKKLKIESLIDVHFRKMRFQIPAFLNFLTNRELY